MLQCFTQSKATGFSEQAILWLNSPKKYMLGKDRYYVLVHCTKSVNCFMDKFFIFRRGNISIAQSYSLTIVLIFIKDL